MADVETAVCNCTVKITCVAEDQAANRQKSRLAIEEAECAVPIFRIVRRLWDVDEASRPLAFGLKISFQVLMTRPNLHRFQLDPSPPFFGSTSRREHLWFGDSPSRRTGGIMTLSQLVEQTRSERDKPAAQLRNLDAALAALTKIETSSSTAKAKFGRTWTPEQRARLSASLKRVFAAKKAGRKAMGIKAHRASGSRTRVLWGGAAMRNFSLWAES